MTDSEHDEKRLLERVRAADTAAFKILFEKYQPVLFRYLAGRLRDADLAHDIVQETFVRVWERRMGLKPHLPFYPYIYRISTNLLKDHLKHAEIKSRYANETKEALYPEASRPEDMPGGDALDARALEEKIRRIVNEQMGDRCRMIFLLSRVEGKTNREIAEMLQLSIKTVENQITHALKVLRKGLRMVR